MGIIGLADGATSGRNPASVVPPHSEHFDLSVMLWLSAFLGCKAHGCNAA